MSTPNWAYYLDHSPRITILSFSLTLASRKLLEEGVPIDTIENIIFDHSDRIIISLCDLIATKKITLVGGDSSEVEAFRKQKIKVEATRLLSSLDEKSKYVQESIATLPEEIEKINRMRTSLGDVWIEGRASSEKLAMFPSGRVDLPPSLLEYFSRDADAAQPSEQERQINLKQRKRLAVTQKAAARVIQCSESCIKKWERGESMPEGYPGRYDLLALRMFAATYNAQKAANRTVRAMNRASSGHNIDNYADPYEENT